MDTKHDSCQVLTLSGSVTIHREELDISEARQKIITWCESELVFEIKLK